MKQFLLALLVVLATASHAAAQIYIPLYLPAPRLPDPKPADLSNIHSVAVISTLGDSILISTNQFMAPSQKRLDTTSWNINAEIEARLAQYLSPRFTFKNVPFDHGKLASEPSIILDRPDNLSSFLATLPKDVVDAYIVVRPGTVYRGPGYNGLALQNGGDFGADGNAVVWANFQIIIVDARTSKVLTKSYSRLRFRDKAPPSFASMTAPDTLKLKDDATLTDQQSTQLRGVISFVLNNAITETLRSLDLGVALPPPGARGLAPIPPDKNPYRNYKKIAVASLLGDQILLEHPGSIFNRSSETISKPDWRIDDLVETRANAVLSRQFTVVLPSVDRAALAKALTEDGKDSAKQGLGINPGSEADLVVAFVNVTLNTSRTWPTKGIGVLNYPTPNEVFPNGTWVFAHFAVAVIDAKNMKVLYSQTGVASPDRGYEEPQEVIDDATWPQKASALTTGQAAQIRDKLGDVLENSIDETLLQLGLLGVFPTEANSPNPGLTVKAN